MLARMTALEVVLAGACLSCPCATPAPPPAPCCGPPAISAAASRQVPLGEERPASIYGWERNFNADGTPRPLRDPVTSTVWPNRFSRANSDEWIARNMTRIRQMRPRLLVVNLSNTVESQKPLRLIRDLAAAVQEGSRYHGYKDAKAPAFLQYSVWRYVDLRDGAEKNSSKSPVKPDVGPNDINVDYGGFFSEEFARHIGVRDPRSRDRFLRLDELIDQGYVHEVWMTAAPTGDVRALECIELKQAYDEQFRKIPGKYVQAGNGGDEDQKWTGRSVRINILNHDRGIGCGMENLAHSFEGMAHGKAIPYFTRWFYEFAGFDLDKRWGLPWNSYYPLWGEGKGISYPDPSTAVVTDGEKTWRLENYVSAAGNVHFPPNGRSHYDQANTQPVMSTIEDWRIGSGPDGQDVAKPWTNAVLAQYEKVAPDCMGKWLVYWRQNVPGYRNLSRDDAGRPMLNWWVFLYF